MAVFANRKIRSELIRLFTEKAESVNGLYNGLDRIFNGDATRNSKSINEFYQRLSYIPEYSDLYALMQKKYPLEDLTPKKLSKLGAAVSGAILHAEITHSSKGELITADRETVLQYQAWNGEELFPDGKIRVVMPAWFQNGKLIEQGFGEPAE